MLNYQRVAIVWEIGSPIWALTKASAPSARPTLETSFLAQLREIPWCNAGVTWCNILIDFDGF